MIKNYWWAIALIALMPVSASAYDCDGVDEFGEAESVPDDYVCDDIEDCFDGSDEWNCVAEEEGGEVAEEEGGEAAEEEGGEAAEEEGGEAEMWLCDDGVEETLAEWVCDGSDDCADGSDEMYCGEEGGEAAEEGGEAAEEGGEAAEEGGEAAEEGGEAAEEGGEAAEEEGGEAAEEEGGEAAEEEGREAAEEEGGEAAEVPRLSDALEDEAGCATSGNGSPFGWALLFMAAALVGLRRRQGAL